MQSGLQRIKYNSITINNFQPVKDRLVKCKHYKSDKNAVTSDCVEMASFSRLTNVVNKSDQRDVGEDERAVVGDNWRN